MGTRVLFHFNATEADVVFDGAFETRRIVAASDAIFQQFIEAHFLTDPLSFVQLDGRMVGTHVVLLPE